MSPREPSDPSRTSAEGSARFGLADLPVPMVYATHRIIRDCNTEFAAIFGYEQAELIDQSFSRLYPKIRDFVRTGEMWRSNFAGGKVYYDERLMRRRDGTSFWCKVRGRSRNHSDPFAEALYCFEPMNRPAGDASLLSDRQKQVLTLVSQGKTNGEIALELGLSQRTIEAHRARLMRAHSLRNSAELIAWFSNLR
ncbi:LuxR C-terminal-related transcriptional regulator [Phyllobacterium sp. 0TCS1.6C]|uniref:LuxR family transcriptional regulator n=1 Tax=unclassified Phyllobacterium TaxID=2638441 RepID=UPI002111FE01|nr:MULTISPECIES: LuxR C-terminal-related transcriptional regulator [unclassified Phyllobacterium]MCX8279838.1 LuxR C-terminal-related transcriptional regulator [Phyllobacterium sp. 0TCS1.6C]MCX8295558.1 LuxR C-terminal-related transcriptional regulator [Phyllobacterium sp. 0TCS1.6A]